jgi:hypothetical protein
VSSAPDGYCNQCAEIHDKPPGLVGKVQDRFNGVICSACGMTTVDAAGNCTGHNHGVDLRRKREGSVLAEACVSCGGTVENPVRDLFGVPFCDDVCRREYADEQHMRSPEVRAVPCPRCNAPVGYSCTNLAEESVWEAGWNHEARRRTYRLRRAFLAKETGEPNA